MKAIENHLKEIDYVEREIKRTQSWKRKKDLVKYRNRLKNELRIYVQYHQQANCKNFQNSIDK